MHKSEANECITGVILSCKPHTSILLSHFFYFRGDLIGTIKYSQKIIEHLQHIVKAQHFGTDAKRLFKLFPGFICSTLLFKFHSDTHQKAQLHRYSLLGYNN